MVKLDYLTMKSQHFFLVAAFIMVYMCMVGSTAFVMCLNAGWYSALFASIIFSVQEKNNLNRLYGSTSISQKDVVFGRYIFLFLMYAVSIILGMVCYSLVMLLKNRVPDFSNITAGICLSFFVFSIIIGVQSPMLFKLGYTKARVWSMLPFIGIMFLIVVPFEIVSSSGISEYLRTNQSILMICCVIVSCIILSVSFRASVALYRKRL
jgi:hypothetical protein